MSYQSIIVHLQLGQQQDCLLQLAGNLAERFHARLLGVCASLPEQLTFGSGDGTAIYVERDNVEIFTEMAQAEAHFRTTVASCAPGINWVSSCSAGSIAEYVATVARSADLLLTGSIVESMFDSRRQVDIDHLVRSAGRPVLVVPPEALSLQLDNLLVVWDDSREARRAIADALPLLKKANRVTVLHLTAGIDAAAAQVGLDDVIAWLGIHDVVATAMLANPNHTEARQLDEVALALASDLIISGDRAHSRLWEWFTGGAAQDRKSVV